jgi:hypothetical protein
MTDDKTPEIPDDDAVADDATNEAAEQADPKRPSPATSAASRARRIGGRPMPTPQRAAEQAAVLDKAKTTADTSKQAEKKAERKAVKAEKKAEKAEKKADKQGAVASREAVSPDLAVIQRRLDRVRWIPAVLAGAAVVAMLVVGVWQSHGVWWGNRLQDTRSQQQQEVLAAAKSCTVSILSYDYRRLPAAQSAATACVTEDFKTAQYDKAFKIVQQLAPEKKAVLQLSVENGGVQSVSKDGKTWVVLLYGQLAYSDKDLPKDTPQRLDISSSVVTLTKSGGRWLVAKLDPTG